MLITNSKLANNLKALIRTRNCSKIFDKVRDEFIENLSLTENAKENYEFILKVAGYYTDPYNFQLKDPSTVDVDIVNVYVDITEDMRSGVASHNLQKVYDFLDQF